MHILLVRHGQSTNNVIEAELGDCPEFYQRRVVDPALSSLGERQAAALARHVGAQLRQCAAQGRITMVCSSMARAMQTAEPLSKAIGVAPTVRPDLVERCAFFSVDSAGTQIAKPGPTAEDVKRRFPSFDVSELSASPEPVLETAAQARARAARVAAELLATAKAGDSAAGELLVLVAHADFIGMLVRALVAGQASNEPEAAAATVVESATEQPKTESYWDLNNTATVHLVIQQPSGRVRLLHWNRSEHLTEALRSGVAWRNMPGCEAAAQWARHGEGGSGLSPLFAEASTLARPGGSGPGVALAAAFVAGAVLGVAAARRVL
eukprot:Transcript_7971.p1 GENE.Transcript_7971~~Transcript_7971.p1  ORF type:complete len:361 (-),score=103.20 Transcript_7971:100-1068(-)